MWQDIDYKGGPRQLQKSRGSYAKLGPYDASSSQEDHCCLGSPSKEDAEKPPRAYWGELPRSPVKSPPKVPKPPGEEPLLYISRDKRSVIKLRPLPPPPEGPSAPMPRPSPGTPTPRGKALARPSSPVRSGAPQPRKLPMHTETWVPPETWGSTNRQLKPSKKGLGGKDRANAPSSNNRHLVSRFCHRRKAFHRSKDLEEAQPGGTSTLTGHHPAVGNTQDSVRTVKELLPYRDQFRTAGLAVSSKEQKAYHRRGKLAPLLGKISPGSEWLRLDGGTETKELSNEIVIEVKKDDSPSPINVEQISQKSGEDKLSNASPQSSPTKPISNGHSFAERQPGQNPSPAPDEEKENIIPTARPPAPKLQGIPNSDKTLPALPRVFSQVLVRHGSSPSRNSSWSAAMRQFPPTIVEQKEPSPDKQQQKQKTIHRHQQIATPSIQSATSYGTAIIQPAKRYGQLQIRNTQNSISEVTITTKTPPHPSVVSSIELPKSVRTRTRTRTGTPSSYLEQALDEAVRRLQAMGETVVTPSSTVKSSPKSKATGKHKHKRSTSKTAPSPSQRLQKAAALRRQKMLSGGGAAGGSHSSPRSKPSSSPVVSLKGAGAGATAERSASFTPEVEEAMAVIIPRAGAPSRPPPPRPGPGSVLASIEVHCPGPVSGPVSSTYIPKGAAGAGGHAPLRNTRPEPEPSPDPDRAAFPLPPSRPESSRRNSRPDLTQAQAQKFRVSKRSSFISTNQRASFSSSQRRPPSQRQRLPSHVRPPSQQRPPTRRQTHPPTTTTTHSSLFNEDHTQRHSNHPDRHLPAADILKGLKIMCAASADEDLDAWFRHKTGLRLRRFLADLRTFEELGEEGARTISEDVKRRRRRRGERAMKRGTKMGKGKGKGKNRIERAEEEAERGGSTTYERGGGAHGGREGGSGYGLRPGRNGRGGGRDERGYEKEGAQRGSTSRRYGRESGGYDRETKYDESWGAKGGHDRASRMHRGTSFGEEVHENGDADAERKRRSGSGRLSIGKRQKKIGY